LVLVHATLLVLLAAAARAGIVAPDFHGSFSGCGRGDTRVYQARQARRQGSRSARLRVLARRTGQVPHGRSYFAPRAGVNTKGALGIGGWRAGWEESGRPDRSGRPLVFHFWSFFRSMTLPSAGMMSLFSSFSSGFFFSRSTEPSHMTTWHSPSNSPPSFGSGFVSSKGRSAGLLQLTGSPASKTMPVFDVPSGVGPMVNFIVGWNSAFLRVKV